MGLRGHSSGRRRRYEVQSSGQAIRLDALILLSYLLRCQLYLHINPYSESETIDAALRREKQQPRIAAARSRPPVFFIYKDPRPVERGRQSTRIGRQFSGIWLGVPLVAFFGVTSFGKI